MNIKTHLFPHSYLPEKAIKRLVPIFGPLGVCLPWFMDPPEFFRDYELEIINPPGDYRPGGDFRTILSGYRLWAQQNNDKSRREMLKLSGVLPDDANTWEIRRLLKVAAKPLPIQEGEDLPLKYHLLLHLALDIERQRFEIMDIMEGLKERRSLLAGALHDTEEAKGLFAHMDDVTETGIPDSMNLLSLLEAWFGLFNGCISDHDMLVTFSRDVMDHISSQWDEMGFEGEPLASSSVSFSLPDVSSEGYRDGTIEKVRELLAFGKEPGHFISELQGWTDGREDSFALGSSHDIIKFHVRHFPPVGERSFKKNSLLRQVAGKTIILAILPCLR